jgi:LacI family transcriptional regulator
MINGSKGNPTMDDISKLSGFSKGTIDRVLNNRSGVSKHAKEKILSVIEEIGYVTNINASLLSKKRSFKVIAVIPYYQTGDYWEMVHSGIMRSLVGVKHVTIDTIYYNQFDVSSFRNACSHILEIKMDGVIMAPIYKKEATYVANKLAEKSIPLVYVDTKIDDTPYLSYSGINHFDSGYLAAHLLFNNQEVAELVNFNVDRNGSIPNDSMLKRYEGLMQYISDHQLNCKIYNLSMIPYDFAYNIKLFDAFFEEHPNIRHILALNSRTHIISDWLEMRGIKDKFLLGFDMLDKNLKGLAEGYITTLIAERTAQNVHYAMKNLINYLVFKSEPPIKDNMLPIDILNKYNVKYYINVNTIT